MEGSLCSVSDRAFPPYLDVSFLASSSTWSYLQFVEAPLSTTATFPITSAELGTVSFNPYKRMFSGVVLTGYVLTMSVITLGAQLVRIKRVNTNSRFLIVFICYKIIVIRYISIYCFFNAKFCFLLYPTDIIPIFRLSNHTFHYQRLFHTSLADIPYILAADNCEPLGS